MNPKRKRELTAWWTAWRDFFTLRRTAKLFGVSERTVARWLAGGLDEHRLQADGFQTAMKDWNWNEGANVWGIHPLGVVHWLANRAADRGRDADLPGPVREMGEQKLFGCAWESMQEFEPEKYAGPCPPFTWRLLADDFGLLRMTALFRWFADGMEPEGGDGDYVGGPYSVGAETPQRWLERMQEAREKRGQERDADTPRQGTTGDDGGDAL